MKPKFRKVVDLHNTLSPAQREEMQTKLGELIKKYEALSEKSLEKFGDKPFNQRSYFEGVADGLNHAFKLVGSVHDDYNEKPNG